MDVRGTRIAVRRCGQGTPMLVLRGTDASDGWTPWLEHLSKAFDVIVPEHPGFGGRPMPQWLDTVADLAQFYLDLADKLGLDRYHVAGTSLGGWIAAEMALSARHAMISLTLIGAAGVRVSGVETPDLFVLGEEEALRLRFHDPAKADEAVARLLDPATEDVRLSNAITVARVAWQPRMHSPHLQKWLHRIKAPTLVVWGYNDRVLPHIYGDLFAGTIPGALLFQVPNSGHWVHHERPELLAQCMVTYARRAEGKGGTA